MAGHGGTVESSKIPEHTPTMSRERVSHPGSSSRRQSGSAGGNEEVTFGAKVADILCGKTPQPQHAIGSGNRATDPTCWVHAHTLYGARIVERTDLYSLFTYSNDRLWCRAGRGATVDDEGWPRGHFNTRRSSATLKMPFLPWILRECPYLEGGALLLPYITQPLFIMYR